MANQQHLEILAKGIESWNRWRKEHPEVTAPDFAVANLSEMEFIWADFRRTDFSWADLRWTNLSFSNLSEADLSKAKLVKADLSNANLSDARLNEADLSGASLSKAKLKMADLSRANLESASLEEADLSLANLTGANLTGANLHKAVLTGAILTDCDLSQADLSDADLDEASLAETKLDDTIIIEPDSRKRIRIRKRIFDMRILLVIGLLIGLGLLAFVWTNIRGHLLVVLPENSPAYVYLDGEPLQPLAADAGENRYYLQSKFIGTYQLNIYTTQLKDIHTREFTRYKLYQSDIQILWGADTLKQFVSLDTLYTVKVLAEGRSPNINAEGTRVLYIKSPVKDGKRTWNNDLYLYDLRSDVESKVNIRNKYFDGQNWDWDRPFLIDNDQNIYLSTFSFDARTIQLFRISTESGRATRIPLNMQKKYLDYVPLSNRQGILIENKVYSLKGKLLKTFFEKTPLQNELFYGGPTGVLLMTEGASPGERFLILVCHYVDWQSGDSRVLFEMPKGRLPFLSGSRGSKRVVVSEYSGKAVQFYSIIKLWSEDRFVNLTNEILDGDRQFSDGSLYHKTEACTDALARNIVFDYENKIYLIKFHPQITMQDLLDANMDNMQKG